MKTIHWDKSLSVDVDEIDDDHRKLVDLFNMLGEAMEQGAGKDYIEAVLEELITCTAWHFKHEERLMVKHGYEDLAVHRAEHTQLMEGVRAMQAMFKNENRLPSEDDMIYLADWLTGHILGQDMRLGFYLMDRL